MEFMSWTGGLVAQWLRIELAIPRGLATGIGAGHVEKIYFTGFVFRDSFNLELAIFTYPKHCGRPLQNSTNYQTRYNF